MLIREIVFPWTIFERNLFKIVIIYILLIFWELIFTECNFGELGTSTLLCMNWFSNNLLYLHNLNFAKNNSNKDKLIIKGAFNKKQAVYIRELRTKYTRHTFWFIERDTDIIRFIQTPKIINYKAIFFKISHDF